jgi:carboxylesterase
MLHGFTGSPWDLRPLGEALCAAGYRAACPVLPGHGDAAGDISGVTELEWEECADGALRALHAETQAPVHLLGFSMGALLAVALAANHPARVRSLALLAPALRTQDPAVDWFRRLRLLPLERLRPWVPKKGTDIQDVVTRAAAPLMPRWPLGWLRGLLRLQSRAAALAPTVRAPALLLAADRDAVVALSGVRALARLLPGTRRLARLPRSGHVIPRDLDAGRAAAELVEFLRRA